MTARIAVLIGSTRPTRICADIAGWTRDVLSQDSALSYQLLDLAEVDLPFLDEPRMPALGHYQHEHTRAWSRTVRVFDGFLFVFPQYNWDSWPTSTPSSAMRWAARWVSGCGDGG